MSLPNSWVVTPLSNLLDQIVGGGTPSKAIAANFIGTVPFMTVKDMKARFISDTADHISEEAVASSATTKIPADTLVVATRMSLGKIVRPSVEVAINQDLKALFPSAGINKTYIEYFWRSKSDFIQSKGTGTTVKGIRIEDIKNLEVPLAPENEQRRIADKLDTTLARVDALNDRLARITPLLKRFRQSVLAAATSGRLTEDWRGTSSIESWQAKKLIEVCESISDGDHQAPPQSLEGIPFITISAINNGFLDIKKATRNVPESYYEALDDKRKAKIGDVLFSVTGSISIPALVNDNLKFAFQRHIAILRPKIDLISSKFLYFLLGSESIKKQANSVATGTAQLTIPLKGLRIFHISLPTLEEQTEIVRRVETLFAFADRLEARLQSAQTAAERLTPALLAKAFRGELVPQDPNDEPATELLRRLRAARVAQTPPKPKRGRKAAATESALQNSKTRTSIGFALFPS